MATAQQIETVATAAQPIAIELIGLGLDIRGASTLSALFVTFMQKNEAVTVELAKQIGPEAAADAALDAFNEYVANSIS